VIKRLLILVACMIAQFSVAASVQLAWDPPTNNTDLTPLLPEQIGGYRLYWGSVSRAYTGSVNVGNVTSAWLSNLLADTTYYLSGTTYSTQGTESAYCEELIWHFTSSPSELPDPVVLDNLGASTQGAWTLSSVYPGYWGQNYLHDGNTGKGQKSVQYEVPLPVRGIYGVEIRYAARPNYATNVLIDIVDPGRSTNTVQVNQRLNGGIWLGLGDFKFTSTSALVVIRNAGTTNYVVADAVRFECRAIHRTPGALRFLWVADEREQGAP